MAWTAPLTAATGTLTAAQWNTHIRDNLNETEAGKASTIGGYFVTTAANAITQRTLTEKTTDWSAATSSTTYTDLATVGPSVVCTTGTKCIIWYSAQCWQDTLDIYGACSIAVSGATTTAASDAWAIEWDGIGVAAVAQSNTRAVCHMFDALTAGSNTFTMKYRASGGAASFDNRRIVAMPL